MERAGPAADPEALPERYRLAAALANVIVTGPHGLTAGLAGALRAEFGPEQLVELTLTVALASAFSRSAIAWGPPEPIPVTEVPTPGPGRSVA